MGQVRLYSCRKGSLTAGVVVNQDGLVENFAPVLRRHFAKDWGVMQHKLRDQGFVVILVPTKEIDTCLSVTQST